VTFLATPMNLSEHLNCLSGDRQPRYPKLTVACFAIECPFSCTDA